MYGLLLVYVVHGALIGTAIVLASGRNQSFIVTFISFFLCTFFWPIFLRILARENMNERSKNHHRRRRFEG